MRPRSSDASSSEGATHALAAATTDGQDLAGMVVGRWGWGLLANAAA